MFKFYKTIKGNQGFTQSVDFGDAIPSRTKSASLKLTAGFTYVELIVVLSIFAVMTAVALFNYNKFESQVYIKNLSNDIALQLVAAQKASVSGTIGTLSFTSGSKPSYGVYFNSITPTQFLYFADLNNSGTCQNISGSACAPTYAVGGEIQNIINITSNNSIAVGGITSLTVVGPGCPSTGLTDLTVVFKRPSSTALVTSSSSLSGCSVSYFVISIASLDGVNTAKIEVYPSGRIQIN